MRLDHNGVELQVEDYVTPTESTLEFTYQIIQFKGPEAQIGRMLRSGNTVKVWLTVHKLRKLEPEELV